MSNFSPQPDSTGLSDPNYIYVSYLAIFKKKKWIYTMNETSGAAFCQNNKLYWWKCFHHFASAGSELKNYFIKTGRFSSPNSQSTFYILNWLHWYLKRMEEEEELENTSSQHNICSKFTSFTDRIRVATVMFHAWKRKEIECGSMPLIIMVTMAVYFNSLSGKIINGLSLNYNLKLKTTQYS